MFSNSRYRRRLFTGAISVLATGLLAVGLASCGGSGSNGSGSNGGAATLTFSPSSIKLTAGGSGQQASLLLTAPGSSGAATWARDVLPSLLTEPKASSEATMHVYGGNKDPKEFSFP